MREQPQRNPSMVLLLMRMPRLALPLRCCAADFGRADFGLQLQVCAVSNAALGRSGAALSIVTTLAPKDRSTHLLMPPGPPQVIHLLYRYK